MLLLLPPWVLLGSTQILKHDWLVKEGVARDITLDSVVFKRMKQFAQVRAWQIGAPLGC